MNMYTHWLIKKQPIMTHSINRFIRQAQTIGLVGFLYCSYSQDPDDGLVKLIHRPNAQAIEAEDQYYYNYTYILLSKYFQSAFHFSLDYY